MFELMKEVAALVLDVKLGEDLFAVKGSYAPMAREVSYYFPLSPSSVLYHENNP